jgi:hypothetical protein
MIQYSNLRSPILGVVGGAVEYLIILRDVGHDLPFNAQNVVDKNMIR